MDFGSGCWCKCRRHNGSVILHFDGNRHFLKGTIDQVDTQAQDIVSIGDEGCVPGGERTNQLRAERRFGGRTRYSVGLEA